MCTFLGLPGQFSCACVPPVTYIVGGTVRDILLNRTPKDYDILTSAEPQQVAQLFPRAFVLGRSFPICHVHYGGEIIEVSSFGTNSDPSKIPLDAAAANMGRDVRRNKASPAVRRLDGKFRKGKKEDDTLLDNGATAVTEVGFEGDVLPPLNYFNGTTETETPHSNSNATNGASLTALRHVEGPTWAAARRENASKRDFTVNGLLYDPFSRILYDYVGGVNDTSNKVLRTLGPARGSFLQDPARILRAVRLAARAGLTIEESTAASMEELAPSTANLPQGRLQMELAAMMVHGASRRSVELMWRFGILEILLPQHAVILAVRFLL